MKWISLILLTYMTALFAVPCGDAASSNHVHTASELTHSADEDAPDTCSPFCLCACCGIALANPQTSTVELSIPFSYYWSEKIIDKDFIIADNFFSSIWQPPKY